MPVSLSVPLTSNRLYVPDCAARLKEAAKTITRTNVDISFSVENDRGDIFEDAVCFGNSDVNIIKMPDFGIETAVLWMEPTELFFDGKCYSVGSVFCDATRSDDKLGYFLPACIAVVLSEFSLDIIEDSSAFWVDMEFISTSEFLEKVSLPPRLHREWPNIFELAEEFYFNLNWARKTRPTH